MPDENEDGPSPPDIIYQSGKYYTDVSARKQVSCQIGLLSGVKWLVKNGRDV